jgi:hypothetical protein
VTTPRTIHLVDPTGGADRPTGGADRPTGGADRPTGGAPARLALAPRSRDLRGARLGLLDNSKSGSEAILRAIAAILDAEFGWSDVVHLTKHSASLPPRPEVFEALHRRADVVIAGVGD